MKKINTKKKLLAGFVALGVVVGGVITPLTVGAADSTPPVLKIKKVLNLPKDGVKTPKEDFKFTFTPHSKNGKTDLAKDVPEIKNVVISYADTDATDNDTVTPGKQVIKLSEDALANVQWPESGQYTYTVTETAGSTKDMTYSGASYTVSVFTKMDEAGKIVVDNIQIKQDKKDDGTAAENPAKVNYNPGNDDDSKTNNNFSFSNNYDVKAGNGTPEATPGTEGEIPAEDMKGFALMKTVKADKINESENFTFKLNVAKPVGTHSADDSFKYKIVKDGTVGGEQTAKYGTDFEIKLTHNDRIVFSDILLGSTVSATETVDGGYTKSLDAKTVINGTKVATVEDLTKGQVIGNVGPNGVYFVNTQQTPTGILIDNLPYIVVVGVAGLGLIFFAKRRRDTEEA